MVDSLRDVALAGWICCDRQSLDSLDDKVPREVRADQADHLVVIKSSDDFVVRRRVEHLLDLLQEGLAIELCCRHESILSEQNVLTSQGGVEVFVQQVKRLLIPPLKDNLDGIL